jgi:NAD+ synthase (glutamine-hydrolysing)
MNGLTPQLKPLKVTAVTFNGLSRGGLRRVVARTPFIPADGVGRAANCREIFAIQSTGLARRLRHVRAASAVIGVSGGLDSTLALLVTIRALEAAGKDASAVEAVVMPGPGSSERTQGNAEKLAHALGTTVRVIPIGDAVRQHLRAIGHPEGQHDATFENVQARERTQLLMSVANQTGGLVVGTGDLSELALGWCTYNGDQMSMYHVNAGVPKTLVRHLIEWCADEEFDGDVVGLLRDIVATPISPELVPTAGGMQDTEAVIGPYVLHDFFLYHVVRLRERPAKVFALARMVFDGEFGEEEVRATLREFYRRFFANQFKRSAMPDGPKVGTVALSPRGDWRMPSDASAELWLAEVDAL